MGMPTGIYTTRKKNGQQYYRVSITYKNKHISLGSTDSYATAEKCYALASLIVRNNRYRLHDYNKTNQSLSYEKWVILHNFRDNGLYFKTPIYLYKHYFSYHLSQQIILTFDVDDLFFYGTHKIFKRGNYFFVNDFGMQMNILARFGIRNHASMGKDYHFIDKNPYNLRYDNIDITNPYHGVEKNIYKNKVRYKAKIHVNGYIVLGYFQSIHKAAIAYNKAIDFIHRYVHHDKNYTKNYIDSISQEEIDYLYTTIVLPKYLINLAKINELLN
jgi:hypothetical protein